MPNIVSNNVNSTGLSVQASNGARITLTTSWIYTLINSYAGSDPELLRQTVQRAVAEQIASTLGYENVLADQISFDCDMVTGEPTDLGFSN